WVKWAREIFDQEHAGQCRDRFRRVSRPLPVPNAASSNLPALPHTRDTVRDGRPGERCEAAGVARPDEKLRQAPHLSLAQHANEPVAMSNSRARPDVHENGLGNLEMGASRPL